MTEQSLSVPDADQALQRLLEGNRRFAAGDAEGPNRGISRRVEIAHRQQPFALVIGCVDSRVPPELIFDQGLGDLFVIRSAGHIVDRVVLGNIEFGVAEFHIPLIVVLGHQRCGALAAAANAIELGHTFPGQISVLVEALQDAMEAGRSLPGDRLENAVRINVEQVVAHLKSSPVVSEALCGGKVRIVGMVYELDSGLVEVTVP
jgi:carbonic anhydrase